MPLKDVIGAFVHYCHTKTSRSYFSTPERRKSGVSFNALFFVSRGRACFSYGKKEATGGKNDIFVWDRTRLMTKARNFPGSVLTYTFLAFDLFSSRGEQILLSNLGFPLRIKVRHPAKIKALLDRISRLARRKENYHVQECSALVLKLLQILKEDASRGASGVSLPNRIDPRIETVLQYIEIHNKENPSLKFLAEKAFMHPRYFLARFKKATGLSPHRYLLERKISKAKDYLGLSEEALLNTGEHLGFHDYSHFYRTFKKVTGMTPGEFVKKKADF
jgi:AraC-like DNA-binding protein